MNDIQKRLAALEAAMSKVKIATLWVTEVDEGKYMVERPAAINAPGSVSSVPETLYGQIIDADALRRWSCVVVAHKDGGLTVMIN